MKTKLLALLICGFFIVIGFLLFWHEHQSQQEQAQAKVQPSRQYPERQTASYDAESGKVTGQKKVAAEVADVADDDSSSAQAVIIGGIEQRRFIDTQLQQPLAQHLGGLMARFEQGDFDAGYILSVNLSQCQAAPLSEDELNKSLVEGEKTLKLLKGVIKDMNASDAYRRQQLMEKYEFCKGTPKALIEQSFDILEKSALGGSLAAQSRYVMLVTPMTNPENPVHKLNEQQIKKAKEVALHHQRFLKQAIAKGSMTAFRVMTYQTMPTASGRNDPVTALAYNQAAMALLNDDKFLAHHQQMQERLTKDMTGEEIAAATELAAQIADKVLKQGVIYID